MPGIIAIVGRPNVGKSALFNRIAGKRIAIVHDEPGVTRDRVSAEAEWHGIPFTIIDTGGIGLLRGQQPPNVIARAALDQVLLAVDTADVIVQVVDAQSGLVPLDLEVGARMRSSGKSILLAVNKVDSFKNEAQAEDFARLGYSPVFMVSAIHGTGIDELVTAALALLPKNLITPPPLEFSEDDAARESSGQEAGRSTEEDPLKLAIVGRPNVGKSSLVNALTRSDRVIVSPIPGTTRDAVDVPFEVDTDGVRQKFILIDTAGMRKARRIDDSVEFFSVKRAEESIHRADVVVLVLDAEAGITEQDKKIADKIVEARRACVIVINKWDLAEADVRKAREEEIVRRAAKSTHRDARQDRLTTLSEFGEWVQRHLFFLSYAPVIFTSAKTGFHLDRLLEAVRYVASQLKQKVPTALLNRVLADAIAKQQPVSSAGHLLKFFYATQVSMAPPVFLLFVNRDEILSESYEKYLANQLRAAFGYEGCPVLIRSKARPKTIVSQSHRKTGGNLRSKDSERPPESAPERRAAFHNSKERGTRKQPRTPAGTKGRGARSAAKTRARPPRAGSRRKPRGRR